LTEQRFEGRIAGLGSTSGVRVVVGWWRGPGNDAVGGETSTTVIITSVVTGIAGILSTAVAELVKKRPSAAEADTPY
jgi:hypothetical protein